MRWTAGRPRGSAALQGAPRAARERGASSSRSRTGRRPGVALGEEPRHHHRRGEEPARIEERPAEIPDVREEAEEYCPEGRRQAADVVAEAGSCRAEERGEERRQVHREESEDARAEPDDRHPEEERAVSALSAIGDLVGEEEGQREEEYRLPVADEAREPACGEVPGNRAGIDEEERKADELFLVLRLPRGQLPQVAEVLVVPEDEGPPAGQRERADEDRPHGDGEDVAAEEVAHPRLVPPRTALRRPPLLRLGHRATYP